MKLGEYITRLRVERGWSVSEAAKRCKVSVTRWTEVFDTGISRTTGKATSPSLDFLTKVAAGFSIPLPMLLDMAGMADSSPDQLQEAELVQVWRTLRPTNRSMAIALVRTMKDQEELDSGNP